MLMLVTTMIFICRPSTLVVADFGCGDCKIARSVKNKVHSFDLASTCDLVTVCDMANVSELKLKHLNIKNCEYAIIDLLT